MSRFYKTSSPSQFLDFSKKIPEELLTKAVLAQDSYINTSLNEGFKVLDSHIGAIYGELKITRLQVLLLLKLMLLDTSLMHEEKRLAENNYLIKMTLLMFQH